MRNKNKKKKLRKNLPKNFVPDPEDPEEEGEREEEEEEEEEKEEGEAVPLRLPPTFW